MIIARRDIVFLWCCSITFGGAQRALLVWHLTPAARPFDITIDRAGTARKSWPERRIDILSPDLVDMKKKYETLSADFSEETRFHHSSVCLSNLLEREENARHQAREHRAIKREGM